VADTGANGEGASAPLVDPRPGEPSWPNVTWPPPQDTVLEGPRARLRLARPDDADALFVALDHDGVWAHVKGRPLAPSELRQTIREAQSQGRWMWVVESGGEIVGSTSFLDVSPVDARLEIGFTAYTPRAWGTGVNAQCKLLLMTWAFDEATFRRVQLKTDIRNARSQVAIARLGAQREGVLRCYQRRQDGSIRDTVMFSVLSEEWPAIRARLTSLLARAPLP
jgi:RimJ/RimL family protein N-acetyltransferase